MRGAVIVAAGKSARFGRNKLNENIFDVTVLQQTVSLFDGLADFIAVVCDEQTDLAVSASRITVVHGGSTRSRSVRAGLNALDEKCETVAIHDGARPFVSRNLVRKLFEEAEKCGSAVPRLSVSETLWTSRGGGSPENRDEFFTVQTPQVFNRQKISAAFERSSDEYTDESALFYHIFGNVHFVDGEFSNKKITVPSDLPIFRAGVGFDVHAFGEGSGVILGGVTIPYPKKLVGHSDADVLTHAVCDAVLSASDNRDIGCWFPDTDDKYLGISSLLLLEKCVDLAAKKGFCVQNVSAVVICQAPKIAPHIEKIAANLARVLDISPNCVNITATTTEHLGALGNGDGIAVQAQALLTAKK